MNSAAVSAAAGGNGGEHIVTNGVGHQNGHNNGQIGPAAAVRPESLPTSVSAVDKDKSTLKVHLPNGGFNVVKYGDATDIKVRK